MHRHTKRELEDLWMRPEEDFSESTWVELTLPPMVFPGPVQDREPAAVFNPNFDPEEVILTLPRLGFSPTKVAGSALGKRKPEEDLSRSKKRRKTGIDDSASDLDSGSELESAPATFLSRKRQLEGPTTFSRRMRRRTEEGFDPGSDSELGLDSDSGSESAPRNRRRW